MLMVPQNLPENIQRVQERVMRAASGTGRTVDSVTLLAVSKGQPAEAIRAAASLGLREFGENYAQDALAKVDMLRDLDLVWHFIGQLQTNKTRPIAAAFSWVHSIDRLRIAERLSAQRPYHTAPLNVCLQVNIAGEATKAGVAPHEVPALAAAVAELPRLKLRGLMCVPPAEADRDRQLHWFGQVRELFDSLNAAGAGLDTLSMGMSDDLEAAIASGATIVRIGTAIFGPRT